jgi:DNA-binding transcriptional regulator GbsR (MarR family)
MVKHPNMVELDHSRRELVEKIGVINEKIGMQPVAARINALLQVSNNTLLTFDEIQETLQVSKSSVSNAINILLSTGQIEYFTKPGERKRYFRSNMEKWPKIIDQLVEFALTYRDIFKQVLELRSEEDPQFNQSIRDLINFIDYIIAKVPPLMAKWKEENGKIF